MTADHEAGDLAARVARLVAGSLIGASAVSVVGLARMFGGNARTAWSFALHYREGGTARELPCVMLSQPPAQHVASDVGQELRVLRGLSGQGLRIPRALAVDADGTIVGAPSIVLERLPGKASAVDFLRSTDVEAARRVTADLAGVVAELHRAPCPHSAFAVLAAPPTGLAPRELVLRQVAHWRATFEAERMEPLPVLASLFQWLETNAPEPRRIALVHGDLRPGNFLFEGSRVTGLLDWEMAHPGDPLEDVAWVYRPMWSPEAFLPLRDFVDLYSRLTGAPVAWGDVLYYRIFSELKFATISLNAARAFSRGATRNLRHADRAAMVGPCVRRALEWTAHHREETRDVQADGR